MIAIALTTSTAAANVKSTIKSSIAIVALATGVWCWSDWALDSGGEFSEWPGWPIVEYQRRLRMAEFIENTHISAAFAVYSISITAGRRLLSGIC